jgi:tetratricopeptide (TPR) repeat protein
VATFNLSRPDRAVRKRGQSPASPDGGRTGGRSRRFHGLATLKQRAAAARYHLGEVALARRSYDEARGYFEAALRWYRDNGPEEEVAFCERGLGLVAYGLGDYEEARARYQVLLRWYGEKGREDDVAQCWQVLGRLAYNTNSYDEARHLHEAALRWYRDNDRQEQAARSAQYLGAVELDAGAYDEARHHHEVALSWYRAHGPEEDATRCLWYLGRGAFRVGAFDEARQCYGTALDWYMDHGPEERIAECEEGLGTVAFGAGAYDEARRHLEAASRRYRENGLDQEAARSGQYLGSVALMTKSYDEARQRYQTALRWYQDQGRGEGVASCERGLGLVAIAVDAHEEARLHLEAARRWYRDHGRDEEVAICEQRLGLVALSLGAYEEAQGHYEAGRRWFKESGREEDAADGEEALVGIALIQGHRDEALTHAIRSAVGFDQLRYRLARPDDRRRWLAQHTESLERALSLALEVGDRERVAILVEAARVQGVPTRELSDKGERALEVYLAGMVPDPDGTLGGPTVLKDAKFEPSVLSGSAVDVALGEEEALCPPHGVRLARGRPSLAESVGLSDLAEALGVAEVAQAAAGPAWWWWGSWVVGDQLYWFLFGHDGSLFAERVPMLDLEPVLAELARSLPEKTSGESGDAYSARMAESCLVDPASETDLARRLGSLLLPDPLVRLLATASADNPLSLAVAPAPEIAAVPLGWLAIDQAGTRVVERAQLRLAASLGLLAEARRARPRAPGDGTVAVVDPGGGLLFDPNYGTDFPAFDEVLQDLSWAGARRVLTRRAHLSGPPRPGDRAGLASSEELRQELSEPRPKALVYLGHISWERGRPSSEISLVLSGTGPGDALVPARRVYRDRPPWPMAERVALVACGGARQAGPEWLGLAPAAIYAGATVVLAALWNLVWATPTYRLALDCLACLTGDEDTASAWRKVQLRQLGAWRDGDPDAAPIYWAGIAAIGFAEERSQS